MNGSNFQLVFDISDVGYRYWKMVLLPAGFCFFSIAVFLVRYFKSRKQLTRVEFLFWFGFCSISGLAALGVFITFFDYRNAVTSLKDGTAKYVEGKVEDFTPMPFEGHAVESFQVNGVSFEFSDYILSVGYNNTIAHGGVIREGSLVRIWYENGQILRLELAGTK